MVSGAIPVEPYCGLTSAERWLTSWNLDPAVIAAVAILMVVAARTRPGLRTYRWSACALAAILWLSPLCAISATLLSARVAHHMISMLLLAPVLALAWPRLRIGEPITWALLSALFLTAWFVPVVYAFAWESDGGYWFLQLAMLGAAWQFWAAWFAPAAQHRPLVLAAAPAMLAMVMGFVGALLTFAPRPLFVEHIATTVLFGAPALWDQQLAGLVMWTAGMVPLAIMALSRVGKAIGPLGQDARC